jgi:hypothetical protein
VWCCWKLGCGASVVHVWCCWKGFAWPLCSTLEFSWFFFRLSLCECFCCWSAHIFYCLCVRTCVRLRACVRACVCVRVCTCVCVRVCMCFLLGLSLSPALIHNSNSYSCNNYDFYCNLQCIQRIQQRYFLLSISLFHTFSSLSIFHTFSSLYISLSHFLLSLSIFHTHTHTSLLYDFYSCTTIVLLGLLGY